jgi:hypothetical protein
MITSGGGANRVDGPNSPALMPTRGTNQFGGEKR